MAGHSKFKNIQHRKGAQDKKRAKLFTKLVREILTSAKSGQADPAMNPRLRSAMAAARIQNVPKDRIDRALFQASNPSDGDNYEEMRYEGFAPGGIAMIVEALTDNRNRTASEVRSSFTKYGGNLGETGSVSFMFDHVGIIEYPAKVASNDQIFEAALEAGAEDVDSDEEHHIIYTSVENFSAAEAILVAKYGDPTEAHIGWRPKNVIEINDKERAEKLMKMIDMLEDSDDVQRVFGNYELSEELYKSLTS